MEALKQELQVLSERYSQKCLEIGALTRQAEEREHTLRRCQQEGQELLRHNQVDSPAGGGWVRPAWCPHPD